MPEKNYCISLCDNFQTVAPGFGSWIDLSPSDSNRSYRWSEAAIHGETTQYLSGSCLAILGSALIGKTHAFSFSSSPKSTSHQSKHI